MGRDTVSSLHNSLPLLLLMGGDGEIGKTDAIEMRHIHPHTTPPTLSSRSVVDECIRVLARARYHGDGDARARYHGDGGSK